MTQTGHEPTREVPPANGLDLMKRAYAHAIASRYRFYSYGDACLLSPARAP